MQSKKTHFNWRTTPSIQNPSGVGASILKRGFTLLEMVVTLSIIAILAVVVTTQFSGDSAKATKILHTAETIKKAMLRMKMDTGRYPCTLDVLWDPSLPPLGNDNCLSAAGATWNGPYTEKIDSSSAEFPVAHSPVPLPYGGLAPISGYRTAEILYVFNIPESVASELMKKCSGNDAVNTTDAANFADGNCYLEDWAGGPGPYTLLYLVGLTR